MLLVFVFFIIINSAVASLPTAPTIQHGIAKIKTKNNTMKVRVKSRKGIINWKSFNISKGHNVVFKQPNAKSVVLNRVTGKTSSSIAGSLHSNGKVFLVNPNGIMITKTGVIKPQSFVASTLNISNKDFLEGKNSGRYNFEDEFSQYKYVTNDGEIATEGGFVALLGGAVKNNGVINASAGTVAIGSGQRVVLDVFGGNFLQVLLPIQDASLLKDENGKTAKDVVCHSGEIIANSVYLSAKSAKNAVRNMVNLDGVINFNTIHQKDGKFVLSSTGDVSFSKTSKVINKNPKGKITINADKVNINGIFNLQGKGSEVNINSTRFDLFGSIFLNSTDSDAGSVSIFSDLMNFSSDSVIEAKSDNGKGGRVIISGRKEEGLFENSSLNFDGQIDVSSENGGGFIELSASNLPYLPIEWVNKLHLQSGVELLIDPKKIFIVENTRWRDQNTFRTLTGHDDPRKGIEVTQYNRTQILKIHRDSIVDALNTGANVTLQANDLIHVRADINVTSQNAGHLR